MPILANWVRAYMIVMIGHLSDNRLAAGVDHIIYGWVFFGLVIGVMFMIGARFAEPDAPVPAAAPANNPTDPTDTLPARGLSAWAVGAAAVLLLASVQTALWRLDRPHAGPLPVLALPDQLGGWTAGGPAISTWLPAYANAAASAAGTYSAGDAAVGLRVGYYRDQGYDRKLVTSTNNLVDAEEHGAWAQTESGGTAISTPTGSLKLRTADLRGSAEPGSPSAQRLRVWHVYWIGGHYTTSDAVARLRLAVNRLMGQGDDAAVVFFYTSMNGTAGAVAADAVLTGFANSALPALDALLAGARQRP
jgi:EpsI family protein